MQIISRTIHLINYELDAIEYREAPAGFNDYIEDLIRYVNGNKLVRRYMPNSQSTEVVTVLKNLVELNEHDLLEEDEARELFETISNRLLQKEVETQAMVNRLGVNIKKGSLVQALLFDEDLNEYIYLATKVEHTNFIDDVDFSFKTGFARDENSIWRSAIFNICSNEDGIFIDDCRIYLDGRAKYWHHDFLELHEILDDEANTDKAFKSIDRILATSLKKVAPSDHTFLRNALIGCFQRAQLINYEPMVNTIFEGYEPNEYSQDKLTQLREKLLQLPEKQEFDRQFNIIPKVVNARKKKIYPVNQGVELRLKDYVTDIDKVIQSDEDVDGNRYLKIRTTSTETYKAFKR